MTNEEIKNIIFAMNNNKILGQNGYRAYFFKKVLEIMGEMSLMQSNTSLKQVIS